MNQTYNVNLTPYWQDVHNEMSTLQASVARQSMQPTDGTAYIISVKKRSMPEHREGVVSVAPLKLCAQRIVEEVCRLATDEEISEYLKRGKESKKAADAVDARSKGNIVFQQSPRPA